MLGILRKKDKIAVDDKDLTKRALLFLMDYREYCVKHDIKIPTKLAKAGKLLAKECQYTNRSKTRVTQIIRLLDAVKSKHPTFLKAKKCLRKWLISVNDKTTYY